MDKNKQIEDFLLKAGQIGYQFIDNTHVLIIEFHKNFEDFKLIENYQKLESFFINQEVMMLLKVRVFFIRTSFINKSNGDTLNLEVLTWGRKDFETFLSNVQETAKLKLVVSYLNPETGVSKIHPYILQFPDLIISGYKHSERNSDLD